MDLDGVSLDVVKIVFRMIDVMQRGWLDKGGFVLGADKVLISEVNSLCLTFCRLYLAMADTY
jgi:hypothetical protein